MKKAVFEEYGFGPDVVKIVETKSLGNPQSGEIKVSLVASPVNPSDLLAIEGQYGLSPTPLPAGVGKEALGKVTELGANVHSIKINDYVYFNLVDSTWTEHFVLPAKRVIPLPSNIDPLQLCMSVGNPMSAYLMIKEFVELAEGDWLIQNAANSGVGTNVIKMAKQWGLKTVNIVRRHNLVEPLKSIGADIVIVDSDHLVEEVKAQTEGSAIKLALDAIGGGATQKLASTLANAGIVVNYGLISGENCQVSPQLTVFNDISLKGFWLQKWFSKAQPESISEILDYIVQQISNGALSVPVEAHYPLEDVVEALAHSAKEGREGKIVITGPAF